MPKLSRIVASTVSVCLLAQLVVATGCTNPRYFSDRIYPEYQAELDLRDHLFLNGVVEFETLDGEQRSGVVDEVHADAFLTEGHWYRRDEVVWLRASQRDDAPPGPKVLVRAGRIDFRDHLEFGSNVEVALRSGEKREGLVDAVRADAFVIDGYWYSEDEVQWFREVNRRDFTDLTLVLATVGALTLGLMILLAQSLERID